MMHRVLLSTVVFGVFAIGGANSGGEKKTAVVAQQKGSDDLAKLGKTRLDAAEKAYKSWRESAHLPDTIYQISVRWLAAELDLSTKKEERIAAYNAHLERTKAWLTDFKKTTNAKDVIFYAYDSYQKEAEYWLALERSGAGGGLK
jgi:hypothetical protein